MSPSLKPIYFDYMATTPVDPRVIQHMTRYLGPDAYFGNPASTTHVYGQEAAKAVEHARWQIADTVQANAQSIVFTSGATEANNLALFGAAYFYKNKGKHLITMTTEHKAVLDCFSELERQGFDVTYLSPESSGLLNLDHLKKALRPDTILVSVMHVNNEIGVIQDIASIGALLKDKGIIFHVDAAQSVGKIVINLSNLPVHLMSFSAHKVYGPKGIGALFVRHKPRVRLKPQIFGGGHENGLRSGTLPTHQIVGMGEAFALAAYEQVAEQERILRFREKLWNGIEHLPGIKLHGDKVQRVAGNLNFSFESLDGESLLLALSALSLSSGSACLSSSLKPSYVLGEIGLPQHRAQNALRLSMGRFTREEHIEQAVKVICVAVEKLHDLLPL